WLRDPSQGGGFLLQTLVHSLDLIAWVCGPITEVSELAAGDAAGASGQATEDIVVLQGRAGEALLSVVGGWTMGHRTGARWVSHGGEGTLQVTSPSHRTIDGAAVLVGARHDAELARIEPRDPIAEPSSGGLSLMEVLFRRLAADFVNAIDDPTARGSL